MATSDFWQRVSATAASSEWMEEAQGAITRNSPRTSKLWMLMDAVTVLAAVIVATSVEAYIKLFPGVREFWQMGLIDRRSTGLLVTLLAGFIFALIYISDRLHLYSPARLGGFLSEQRRTVQACFTSGLLLTGAIYLVHASSIPRGLVLISLGLVLISLSVRRLVYRVFLYRRFERGVGTRNVLIIGTGPEAHALRHHVDNIRHLGYTFKGFIEFPGASSRFVAESGDVVGDLDSMFQHARKHFVDEIFFTTPHQRELVHEVLQKARHYGINLRVVPEMYDGLAWNSPIEYIGQFPTIPLHCGHVPELALMLKRAVDVVFSALALVVLSPLMLALAIAIKLDSHGPVFYASERIGKRGRVFRCMKFRTMVRDAEKRQAEIMHMNERQGVLFKISNDPRITTLGRFLRKYSLDELPQFFNVLKGDMSIVGPRPPLASEVREYKLSHLRRLDVTPGITGLWQVQGRQDPSFDSYISLDVTYIENWSVWLDIKIILRTVVVVFAGTGT
ncbi:sugar transferase [Acidobacteria bacterium AB60]|nr:sugar transferase [Acidobacteria bacterium AB60]